MSGLLQKQKSSPTTTSSTSNSYSIPNVHPRYRELYTTIAAETLLAEIIDGKWVYRFANHPRFYYCAFNMIQRKRILQQSPLRSALESSNLSATISADSNIDDDWRNWRNTFADTVSHHIPSTKIRGRNYVPWMNSAILHNIKKKSSLRCKVIKSKISKEHLEAKIKELGATMKKMLRDSRSIEGARTSAEAPEAIASIFNTYFTSIFIRDQPSTEKDMRTIDADRDHSTNTALLEDITLTPDHVAAVLRTLDNDKAHGPDGIPARLLTETAYLIAPSLCDLFNKSMRTGVLPRDWKLANVVPVFMNGDKEMLKITDQYLCCL
ncbi:Hypothetical predicted protein [Paramuricea clavata]|uniref:Uncharacterized protein n=1 Tax=Paramuricea clavata TaxID=317549 RepID=A0A6S7IM60_PARCT|nr:Hypothetical predicted protein [Paramuricea clavata]